MSLRWRHRRAELFANGAAREERSPLRNFARLRLAARGRRGGSAAHSVGPCRNFDFAAPRGKPRRRLALTPLFVVAVVSLLALAFLRVSILRTRYALGATLQRETELRARERSAAVAARVERDPHKLRALAARQGFARPERVIDLSGKARGQ